MQPEPGFISSAETLLGCPEPATVVSVFISMLLLTSSSFEIRLLVLKPFCADGIRVLTASKMLNIISSARDDVRPSLLITQQCGFFSSIWQGICECPLEILGKLYYFSFSSAYSPASSESSGRSVSCGFLLWLSQWLLPSSQWACVQWFYFYFEFNTSLPDVVDLLFWILLRTIWKPIECSIISWCLLFL